MLTLLSHLAQAEWKSTIISAAREIYAPLGQESFGLKLEISIRADSLAVASADRSEQQLSVVIHQGLLDAPKLTPDALRMIICHELGHIFGGAPRRNVPPEWEGPVAPDSMSYMSSEGQADYYASAVCFKKLVDHARRRGQLERLNLSEVGPILKNKCDRSDEHEICLRAALGGKAFLNLIHEFPISCEHHDSSITPRLIRDMYPARQCRLDTMIQGSFCGGELPHTLDFEDAGANSCLAPGAQRPLCWYRDS